VNGESLAIIGVDPDAGDESTVAKQVRVAEGEAHGMSD
jgi:hypothetical protein